MGVQVPPSTRKGHLTLAVRWPLQYLTWGCVASGVPIGRPFMGVQFGPSRVARRPVLTETGAEGAADLELFTTVSLGWAPSGGSCRRVTHRHDAVKDSLRLRRSELLFD